MKARNIKEIDINQIYSEIQKITNIETFRTSLKSSNFIVLNGVDGIGKSCLIRNLAITQIHQNEKVLFLSINNSINQVYQNLIQTSFSQGFTDLGGLNFFVNEDKVETFEAFKSIVMDAITEKDVDSIYIDDISYLIGKDSIDAGEVFSFLKHTSFAFEVQIFITDEANKEIINRSGRRDPAIEDVSQVKLFLSADKLLFLNRLSFYGFPCNEEGDDTNGVLDVIEYSNNKKYVYHLRMDDRFSYH